MFRDKRNSKKYRQLGIFTPKIKLAGKPLILSEAILAPSFTCFHKNILPISQTALLLIITKCDFLAASFSPFTLHKKDDRMFQMCFVSHSNINRDIFESQKTIFCWEKNV
jgi:hypothetical protein